MLNRIKIKTDEEIEIMRKAGKILAEILRELEVYTRVGITTEDIDRKASILCRKFGVVPAFKGYNGFPACICSGLNDTVVHGIPNKKEVLKEGDILSIDMGIIYKNYYSDMAVSLGLGEISNEAKKLLSATKMSRDAGAKMAIEGNTIGDIGFAMQEVAELAGFSIVREMVGHGIGKKLHEEPEVPGYGIKGKGTKLLKNMVLAIEAIVNEGTPDITTSSKDGWTTKTKDGKLSALFEHTVVVGEKEHEVLTIM